LTPPLYDSKQQEEKAYYEGVMHSYASWLIAQQAEGWHVIDVHFAMQRAIDAKRESDPQFTFQPDGVHPNVAGHQIMAAAIILSFAPDFDIVEFGSLTFRTQYAKTHNQLKTNQQLLLEATRHRRPGIPGYSPE
jgi:hypothetical protein